jgi:hypothetical protein
MENEKSHEELLIENESLKNQLLAFKKDESSIKNDEARYRGLLENIVAGVVVHSLDTSIIAKTQKLQKYLV